MFSSLKNIITVIFLRHHEIFSLCYWLHLLFSSHFSQQYISELYYNLRNSHQPDLVDLFEKHLASVVKDIKARAAENTRLEEALKRCVCRFTTPAISHLGLYVNTHWYTLRAQNRTACWKQFSTGVWSFFYGQDVQNTYIYRV